MFNFRLEQDTDDLGVTVIDNLFITTFMPVVGLDELKFYLFGLMTTQDPNAPSYDQGDIVRLLNLEESDLDKIMNTWIDLGLIRVKEVDNNSFIEFVDLRKMILEERFTSELDNPYETLKEEETESSFSELMNIIISFFNGQADQRLTDLVLTWYNDYKFDTDSILFLVESTLEHLEDSKFTLSGKYTYLQKVADAWYEHGVTTYEEAKAYTEAFSAFNKLVYSVLNMIGIKRAPTQYEKDKIRHFLDDMHFSETMILEAAKRSRASSIDYVSRILENWAQQNWSTPDQIKDLNGNRPETKENNTIGAESLQDNQVTDLSSDELDALMKKYEQELEALENPENA